MIIAAGTICRAALGLGVATSSCGRRRATTLGPAFFREIGKGRILEEEEPLGPVQWCTAALQTDAGQLGLESIGIDGIAQLLGTRVR